MNMESMSYPALDFLFEDDQPVEITNLLVTGTKRNKKPRIEGYVENVLPQYNVDDFRSVFRISRTLFEEIVHLIGDKVVAKHPRGGGREVVSVEKTILVGLYYMGCQETIRRIAEKFNISEFKVIDSRNKFLCALNELKDFIKWPKGQRAEAVMSGFEEKRGMKGVLGAIDGSHIAISQPNECHENYVNRKQFHSIILQAVCDHENLITDVYAGWPGSVHDARVFRRSPLFEKLENNGVDMNPTGSYIIGDAAYPLKEYLITPFRDNGHLSVSEKNFNFNHSSTRMVIEHTFGLLKGTWRRLKYCDVKELNTILQIVMGHVFCTIFVY